MGMATKTANPIGRLTDNCFTDLPLEDLNLDHAHKYTRVHADYRKEQTQRTCYADNK
jgi:hypothetical protein